MFAILILRKLLKKRRNFVPNIRILWYNKSNSFRMGL